MTVSSTVTKLIAKRSVNHRASPVIQREDGSVQAMFDRMTIRNNKKGGIAVTFSWGGMDISTRDIKGVRLTSDEDALLLRDFIDAKLDVLSETA